MLKEKIFEKDIQEMFVHASGPGGQNINKVATCVVLHHGPTNIRVKCQKSRSQDRNRKQARYLLIEKILGRRRALCQKKQAEKEKRKRQKRKRSFAGKENMLKNKHRQSDKKKLRSKVVMKDIEKL